MINMQSRNEYNKSIQKFVEFSIFVAFLTSAIYLFSINFYFDLGPVDAIKSLIGGKYKLLSAYFCMCFTTAFFVCLFIFTFFFRVDERNNQHKRGARLESRG